eukprot:TRINITY_DN90611_c0_g1_i1.p1 TRINITY_DN90611_c0_g1~~TRINITY_DN90611_c0_g1_i1.p1  ORF type:complete len:2461 (+),score=603.86 TRINITY_DN90611_c0_g1_i1:174-7556(+)
MSVGMKAMAASPLLLRRLAGCLFLGAWLVDAWKVPPHKIVLTNNVHVPDSWEVFEAELYFGHCHSKIRIPQSPEVTFDAGPRRENPANVGFSTFDTYPYTSYIADCKQALGGCQPHQAYVGLDVQQTKPFLDAMDRNATLETWEKVSVWCVRIFQSEDPMKKADQIAIRHVFPSSYIDPLERLEVQPESPLAVGWVFKTQYVYTECSGGKWIDRPAPEFSMWRIRNLEVTNGRWALSELRFYADFFCEWELRAPITSSSTWQKEINGDLTVFDGNYSTGWKAGCNTWTETTRKGCAIGEGWIGMDFGVRTTVRCIKIYQKQHDPLAYIAERPSYTTGFAIDRHTGSAWDEVDRVYAPGANHSGGSPTLKTPYLGGAPAKWEDTRPPERSAWRLSVDDWTVNAWRVHEAEFHERVDCAGVKLTGSPFSEQGPDFVQDAELIFDGDTAQDSYWESNCPNVTGGCSPEQTWFGLYFRNKYPDIVCFKLFQSRHQEHAASGVVLQVWANRTWNTVTSQRSLGGGGWNRRPSAPWSMWRVLNTERVVKQWRVMEIRAFRDPLCLKEVYRGEGFTSISSGYESLLDGHERGFDALTATGWGADCMHCNETLKYWIGGELPNNTEESRDGKMLLRCIKAWQSPHYDEQSRTLSVDVWDGNDWTPSLFMFAGIMFGGGAGSYMRHPAEFGSKWRLISEETRDMGWRVEEFQFFSDTKCTKLIRPPADGGADVFLSSYTPELPYFEQLTKNGGMFSEGLFAVDFDKSTSVSLVHRPADQLPAWISIDMLSEMSWVRCVKLRQSPLEPEQSRNVRLQWWTPGGWMAEHDEMREEETRFTELGGGGWQRRPARSGSMWRLENLDAVPRGWAVYDIEFYTNRECGTRDVRLRGDAIASGYVPPEETYGAELAFDGDGETAWYSQCGIIDPELVPQGLEMPPLGCAPRQAWVGLDYGADVHDVRCVRVKQVGYKPSRSERIAVSMWAGTTWEQRWMMDGVGGSEWQQRPQGPNTMFRIVYDKRKDEACRGDMKRAFPRTWGLNELELFEDDDCSMKIEGGRPIVSGTIEAYRVGPRDPPNYSVWNAIDGDINTPWSANCGLGWRKINQSELDCRGEWYGLDFGRRSVEVRCMRLMQTRSASSTCCDTAESLSLDRWNGTSWVEASWPHEPPVGYRDIESVRQLGAEFKKLGQCPPDSSKTPPYEALIWEMRTRRNSDSCMIPLSGATVLMAESACVNHPECSTMFGADGHCCPLGASLELSKENRCCCTYLQEESIYVDEYVENDSRRFMAVEYVTIIMSDYLPYPGLAVSFLLAVFGLILPAEGLSDMEAWAYDSEIGACRRRVRRFMYFIAWPFLSWRAFLEETDDSMLAWTCGWFIRPMGKVARLNRCSRLLFWVCIGAILGGAAPWLGIGYLLGQLALWFLFILAKSIKLSTSPFDPNFRRQMKLLEKITGQKIREEDSTATALDVSRDVVGMVIAGVVYFLKFVFDTLVLRAQMISYGGIEAIEASRIVDIFPGLANYFREPADIMYQVMRLAQQMMGKLLTASIGIPQCEGTCVLYASVALIAVLITTTKWLNYDFFGLFAAARQNVKTTRPECQRTFFMGLVLGCLGLTFGLIQCAMVLFSRSVAMANPFRESVWMCEYDDTSSMLLGRILIGTSAIVGLFAFYVSVNGHLLGQDWVVAPLSRWLNMNLDELDPDGAGPEGGCIRVNVHLAVLPTFFGVWLDWWNVNAFLIDLRSKVYAEQLMDPQPCLYCGEVHVKYSLLFTASGRQISLASQIIPYGSIIGKTTEYLNEPAMLYWGTELKCAGMAALPSADRPKLRKTQVVTKTLMTTADILAYMHDFGLPVLRRIVSLWLLVYIFLGTFTITEENLVDWGRHIINTGFFVAFLRAFLETLAESLLSFCIGSIYKIVNNVSDDHVRTFAEDTKKTVLGQCLVGGAFSTMLAVLLVRAGWTDKPMALLLAWGFGYGVSFIALLIIHALEAPLEEKNSRPRGPGATLAKISVGLACGGIVAFVAKDALDIYGVSALMVPVMCEQALVMRLVFVEKLMKPEGESGPVTPEMALRASPARAVLTSRRVFPALTATLAGALIGQAVADGLADATDDLVIQTVMANFIGLFVAVIAGLSFERILNKPSQLLSLTVFFIVFIAIADWNVLVAICIAAFLGSLSGAIHEQRQMWQIIEDDKEAAIREKEEEMKAIIKAGRAGAKINQFLGIAEKTRDDKRQDAVDKLPPLSQKVVNKRVALMNTTHELEDDYGRTGSRSRPESGLRKAAIVDALPRPPQTSQPYGATGSMPAMPALGDASGSMGSGHALVPVAGGSRGSSAKRSGGASKARVAAAPQSQPPSQPPTQPPSQHSMPHTQLQFQTAIEDNCFFERDDFAKPPPQDASQPAGHVFPDAEDGGDEDLFGRWDAGKKAMPPSRVGNMVATKAQAAPKQSLRRWRTETLPPDKSLRPTKLVQGFNETM